MGSELIVLTVFLAMLLLLALLFLGWLYHRRMLRERLKAELMEIAKKPTDKPRFEDSEQAKRLLMDSKARKPEESKEEKADENSPAREILEISRGRSRP